MKRERRWKENDGGKEERCRRGGEPQNAASSFFFFCLAILLPQAPRPICYFLVEIRLLEQPVIRELQPMGVVEFLSMFTPL